MTEDQPSPPVPTPEVEIVRDRPDQTGILRIETHVGPLPPPSSLIGYEQVLPGAAERVFKMAEKNQDMQYEGMRAAIRYDSRNQVIGAVLAGGVLLLTFAVIIFKQDPKAYAALLLEFIALAKLYVDSRKHDGK